MNEPTTKATMPVKDSDPKYSKVAVLAGNFTTTDKDIINIVLDSEKTYTLAEVKEAIKKFKEGF